MGSAKILHSYGSQRQRACFFLKLVTKEISHKVRIPVHFCTEILGRTESMLFENWSQKRIRTRGCVVRILHQRIGWCEFCCVLAFLPCFPLFSFFKLSYLHVNTKTNSNQIRMNLRAKIKIKTCIFTRKKKLD